MLEAIPADFLRVSDKMSAEFDCKIISRLLSKQLFCLQKRDYRGFRGFRVFRNPRKPQIPCCYL